AKRVLPRAAARHAARRASARSGRRVVARRSRRTNVFLSEEQDFTRLFFRGTKHPRRTEKKSGLLGVCLRCSAALCLTVFSVPSVISAHANSVSYAEYSADGRLVHAVVRLPLDDVDLLLR